MAKLELFNVLIKEMKINERNKSLEKDFQKETSGSCVFKSTSYFAF